MMLRTFVYGSVSALLAQSATAAIFVCTDKDGRRHTADRPIAACVDQSQRVLNADGSLKAIVPPAVSPQERSAAESRARDAERLRMAEQENLKRDRMLLRRFPEAGQHQSARVDALRLVSTSIEGTRKRIADLQAAHKLLAAEAARPEGKPMPADLKQRLDANEAMLKAQQSLVQNQTAEVDRINARYDEEARRLAPLWKGKSISTQSMPADPR